MLNVENWDQTSWNSYPGSFFNNLKKKNLISDDLNTLKTIIDPNYRIWNVFKLGIWSTRFLKMYIYLPKILVSKFEFFESSDTYADVADFFRWRVRSDDYIRLWLRIRTRCPVIKLCKYSMKSIILVHSFDIQTCTQFPFLQCSLNLLII